MRSSTSKASARSKLLLAARAREMRFAPTPSEERLWGALRAGRLGVVFRRQVPIGRYIADFASLEARLIVEVDGGYHESRRAADARRDKVLRRAGYRVLRVPAELVHRDLAGTVALVRAAVGAG